MEGQLCAGRAREKSFVAGENLKSFAPVGLLAALVLTNVMGWVLVFVLFGDRPAILGTASIAWVFGMRRAVDADHIAAIVVIVAFLLLWCVSISLYHTSLTERRCCFGRDVTNQD
jgi:hypothetical protein